MSDNKIVNIFEMRKRLRQDRERAQGDIKSEMNYRTEKFLEIVDEQQRRIERLEANLRALVRILKNTVKPVTAQSGPVDPSFLKDE